MDGLATAYACATRLLEIIYKVPKRVGNRSKFTMHGEDTAMIASASGLYASGLCQLSSRV
jgi:hypothetical protein